MSKPLVILVAIIVASVAIGGAYQLTRKGEFAHDKAPAVTNQPEKLKAPSAVPPKPDHGNFQKRFQPTMPPADSGAK